MKEDQITTWLLKGDISIQYQVQRDLLNTDIPQLQQRIESEGWGAAFLSRRQADGHWGKGFYQPKWISSHYTLLDLRHLNIRPGHPLIDETLNLIFRNNKDADGGINPAKTINNSDVCVNGMVLNYACYFAAQEEILKSVVDFLLREQMPDGGFNCRSNQAGAVHSSLHTTLSVAEGIQEYKKNGYSYRKHELQKIDLTNQQNRT